MLNFADDIADRIERGEANTYALLEDWARQMKGYSETHAPWTDRTGNARQSLHGGVDTDGDRYVLYLSHGVEYGIWLEVAHGGNYAIVGPTMDTHIPRIRQTLLDLWSD